MDVGRSPVGVCQRDTPHPGPTGPGYQGIPCCQTTPPPRPQTVPSSPGGRHLRATVPYGTLLIDSSWPRYLTVPYIYVSIYPGTAPYGYLIYT